MEAIAFRLHIRSISTWKGLTTSTGRRFIEYTLLLMALVCFVSLFYLHGLYTVVPGPSNPNVVAETRRNCLSEGLQQQGVDLNAVNHLMSASLFPVVRLHIADDSMLTGSLLNHKEQIYDRFREWASSREYVEDNHKIEGVDKGHSRGSLDSSKVIWDKMLQKNSSFEAYLGGCSPLSLQADDSDICSLMHEPDAIAAIADFHAQQKIYMYSIERGILLMKPESRVGYNVRTIDLTVHKDSACVGPPAAVTLLDKLTGYDPVVVYWSLSALGPQGFLYNVHSKQLTDLSKAMPQLREEWTGRCLFKLHAVSSAVFLFFCISTLVSFTLRETQSRMLRFTYLLQHHTRHELPIFALVFTHVTESLLFVPVMVGLHFFLKSFFVDQLLSFFVTSLVWCAEVFSVVSLRTKLSTNFFPRVFAIYLSFFLLYFIHFPCGFNYVALAVTVLFTLHAMLYCMNALEIPALEAGLISERARRESLQGLNISQAEGDGGVRRGRGNGEGRGSGTGSSGSDNEEPGATVTASMSSSQLGGQSTPPRRPYQHSTSLDHGTPRISQQDGLHYARGRFRQGKATPEQERRRRAAGELLALRGPDPASGDYSWIRARDTPSRTLPAGTTCASVESQAPTSSSGHSESRWSAWPWGSAKGGGGVPEDEAPQSPLSNANNFGHLKSEESLFYAADD